MEERVAEIERRLDALEAAVSQMLAANRFIEGNVFAEGVSIGVDDDGTNPSPGDGNTGGGGTGT